MMNSDNTALQTHLKDYWELVLKHNPTFATYTGDHRYDDKLEDLSAESLNSQINILKDFLAESDKINASDLSREDKLNYRIFRNTVDDHIQFFNFKTHYIPLDHLRGPHIDFPQIIEYHPFNLSADFDNYIARLNAFPVQIDQVIENFERGIKSNITAFKRVIDHALAQVATFTKFSPENNPLYSPVLKIAAAFSSEDKEIKHSVIEAISSRVTPAYKKLYQYLSSEYLKRCRDNEGIWSLPDGTEMYRFFVKYHTTTDLTPEEIHIIGKSEVERISSDLDKVMKKIGFSGSIREFAVYVKTKKQLYPATGDEIIQGYREILSLMDNKLTDYFGRLPEARYDIRKIESYREQAAPAAYYYPPPKDFSRPGYFYVNTYNPQQRPIYGMEALAYHEAVPGHHLQIALMQEQKNIPDFRRFEGSTAYIEGWALYAEKLALEMGFYKDEYSEYGRLTNEIWRAARLVVDTGLHFYKWTRDKAISYCKEKTGLESDEIEVEIDRYIAMPGQALAYKIGELKILELRDREKKKLGSGFDIKRFHDRLLENGALPLTILENEMKH